MPRTGRSASPCATAPECPDTASATRRNAATPIPRSFPPAKPLRRHERAVPVRIKPEVRLAARREGAPAPDIPASDRRLGIAKPDQHVPHRIVGEEPVEVVRLEAPALQRPHRGGRKLREGAQQGLPGGRVAGHVQSKTAVPGDQKRLHHPVPTVALRPAGAAVLKLDQRLQAVGAGLRGAERRAADTGQLDIGVVSPGISGESNARSITHRSRIDGPTWCSGSYSPSTRSCGMRRRSRGITGCHCESRSAHRMAADFSMSLGLWAQAASSDAFRASMTVNDDRSMRLVKGASVPT